MGLFDGFDAQFDTQEEQDAPDDAVNQVVQQFNGSTEDASEDEELADVEKCIAKAIYYKEIVQNGGIVEENGTAEAAEVNQEVKLWARQQMKKLLGGRVEPVAVLPPAPPLFNDREVLVLKKIIERVLLQNGERPVEPVVKPLTKQQPPPKATPVVKKLGTQQPKAKQPVPPAPAPVQPKVPAAKAGQKKPLQVKKKTDGTFDYDAVPLEQVFRDPKDNRLYKFVPHPQEDNRRVKMNVTNQVRTPGAIPMPSPHAMTGISERQSQEALNLGGQANNSVFPDEGASQSVMIHAAAASLANQE